MSQTADPIFDAMGAERTFVRVYELPSKLTNGYCFKGGVPITFINVDWFEALVSGGPESLAAFIRGKNYYSPAREYLVVGDHPAFTFRLKAEPRTAEVTA